jgi:hypothetical protein
MFFKTRGRFSVIFHLRASPFEWEMTEKSSLVLKNIVNHLILKNDKTIIAYFVEYTVKMFEKFLII